MFITFLIMHSLVHIFRVSRRVSGLGKLYGCIQCEDTYLINSAIYFCKIVLMSCGNEYNPNVYLRGYICVDCEQI